MKRAIIAAVGFEVICPYCNVKQALLTTHSITWTLHEIQQKQPKMKCQRCGETLDMHGV
jgi:glutaredoxin